jgi:hypothetical protein
MRRRSRSECDPLLAACRTPAATWQAIALSLTSADLNAELDAFMLRMMPEMPAGLHFSHAEGVGAFPNLQSTVTARTLLHGTTVHTVCVALAPLNRAVTLGAIK